MTENALRSENASVVTRTLNVVPTITVVSGGSIETVTARAERAPNEPSTTRPRAKPRRRRDIDEPPWKSGLRRVTREARTRRIIDERGTVHLVGDGMKNFVHFR